MKTVIIKMLYTFLYVFVSGVSIASTYYISPTGNDGTGDGSFSNPWATFSQGISVLTPGDTLKAMTGTYTERVLVPPTTNGTSSNYITIMENPGDEVKICHNQAQIVRIKGTYIKFIGFEIYDLSTNEDELQGVIVQDIAHHILLSELIVHDFDGHGIDIHGDYVTVENCTIYDGVLANENNASGSSGWSSALKVSYNCTNTTLRNNIIYNNWGEGIAVTRGSDIQVYDNTVYDNFSVNIYIDNSFNVDVFRNYTYNTENPLDGNKIAGISTCEEYYSGWGNHLENVVIKNNIVYNCKRGFAFYGTDSGTGGMKNVVVINNVFFLNDNTSSVIYIKREPEDSMFFYNNIIRTNPDNTKMVFWTSDNVGTLYFDYNFWVNGQARYWNDNTNDWDYSPSGPHDISLTDPLFVGNPETQPYNYDPEEFKLQSNSPAIDAGIDTLLISDYEINPRPLNYTFDMGAYEYGKYWNGNEDNQWSNQNNWNDLMIPTSSSVVNIPSPSFYEHYPVLNSSKTIKQLYLDENALLELNNNSVLKIIE